MAGDDQVFTFDTVAVLVAVLLKKGVTLSMKEYKLMSELDGKRGAGGFDHMFRKVKTRAKELNEKHGDGDGSSKPTPGRTTKGKKTTSGDEEASGKKRGRKTKENETAGSDDEEPESLTKKSKVKEEATGEDDGDGDWFK